MKERGKVKEGRKEGRERRRKGWWSNMRNGAKAEGKQGKKGTKEGE